MSTSKMLKKLSMATAGTMFAVLGVVQVQTAQASPTYLRSTVGQPWGQNTNETAMDTVFGSGNWNDFRYETVNIAELLSPDTEFIFMEGGDRNADELENFLTSNITAIEAWVNDGGSLFMNAAPNEGDGMSLGFGVDLNYPDFDGAGTASAVDPAHPIFNGPFTPVTTNYTGNSFSHATVQDGVDFTSIIENGAGNTVLGELDWGLGHVLFGGMTTTNWHQPQPEALNLRANIIDYGFKQHQAGQSVPEPACLLGLLGVGALGATSLKRKQKQTV